MSERIQFGEPIEFQLPEEKLPPEVLLIPKAENEQLRQQSFQVYIVQSVFDQIWEHLVEEPRLESGGMLIGYPFRRLDAPKTLFVVIVGGVRQDSHNRSVGHFTVGPREIAQARLEIEQQYPGLVSVGWYHSHPGHGVFLSGQDMQIVESIYNAAWHLALVVDPHRGDAAFFRGARGERLPAWLELRKKPLGIEAIALYNRAMEANEGGNTRRLEDFKEWLIRTRSPELHHWQERGVYQTLRLKEMPVLAMDQDQASSSEALVGTSEKEAIARMYQKAIACYEAGQLSSALNTFKDIQTRTPHYQRVEDYIAQIERGQPASRKRQPTPYEHSRRIKW